jgi:hypothetical protein
MEDCSLTVTKKGETDEGKVKNVLIIFFQGDCSQRIIPSRPDSEFPILLWHFMVTVKMHEDFSQNFGDERTGSCINNTMYRLTLPFH